MEAHFFFLCHRAGALIISVGNQHLYLMKFKREKHLRVIKEQETQRILAQRTRQRLSKLELAMELKYLVEISKYIL